MKRLKNRKLVNGLLVFLLLFTMVSEYHLAYGLVTIDTSTIPHSTNRGAGNRLSKDSNGVLHAVYTKLYVADAHIYIASSYDDGATWTNITRVSTGAAWEEIGQLRPSIFIDTYDNIYVVWEGARVGYTTPQIFLRRKNVTTGTWSAIVEVSNENAVQHADPVMIVIGYTAYIVFETNHGGLTNSIYRRTVNKDLVVGGWYLVSNDIPGEKFSDYSQGDPSIAMSRTLGLYTITWSGRSNLTSKYCIYGETNYMSGIQKQLTTDTNKAYESSVSIDSDNNVHIAYQSSRNGSTTNIQIHYGKYSAYTLNFIEHEYISTQTGKSFNLFVQKSPNIGVDKYDRPYITWHGKNINHTINEVTFYRWKDIIDGWQNITEVYTLGLSQYPNLLYEVMADKVELVFWEGYGTDEVRYEDFNMSAQLNYPELLNYTLYNPDGSINDGWLFKGEIYDFECYIVDTSYIHFNFTDGINNITFRYYNQTYLDSIATRNSGIMEFVMSTVYSEYEVYLDNTTRLLWRFILEDNIVDSINVEWNYLIENYISNITFYFTNIFKVNIYNLGNKVYYEYYGSGGHITGGHPYEIYATNGTSLEWSKAYVLKRRWQHFHSLFAWDLGDHECADHDENTGYIQFGTQIRLGGTYKSNYRVNLYIVDGAVDPFPTSNGKVYVKIKVEWENWNASGAFVTRKTDYISAYYDGGDEKENRTTIRLWVDMWFSDLNSSTVVAGRVNSYYYGMVEKATYLIWTGWKPFIAEDEVSTFYDDFRDSTGQIISSTDVELVRHWALIQKLPDAGTGEAGDEDCDTHTWSLTGFREYHHKVADDRMMGIGNPPYEDTKIISMPQSGFVATIYRAIESMGRLVWLGAFNFLKILWGSVDTFATWLGIDTSIFSYIFEYIGTLPNIIINMMGYLSAILQYIPDSISRMFSIILVTIGSYLFMLGMIVDTFLSFWRELTSLFTGGWLGVNNMWEELSVVQWIQLALIGWVPFWWLDRINRSKDGFGTAVSDVKTFLSSLIAVFYLLKDVLIFIGNLISKIWEILPI